MTLRLRVQAAIAFLFLPISAQAWNSLGHQVVAEIAWRQLPPNQRQAIVEILRRHPRFDADFAKKLMDEAVAGDKATQDHAIFLQAGVWPDLIRGNKEYDRPTWHYIDYLLYLTPADEASFAGKLPVNLSLDYPTDLPRDKYNVIQAIAHCKTALQSRAGPDVKAVAYCWFFHLAGDIHQPLHSTALFSQALFPEGDRGGNEVLLLRGKNLHSLWDNLLGQNSSYQNVQKNAIELSDRQRYGDVWNSAPKVVDPNKWAAETVTSLKKHWEAEFKEWNRRSLSGQEYVYVWADGVHFNIRLEEDRQCILVLLGATKDGKKELIAIQDGYRESEQSWRELLLDVKVRGLAIDPKLATGDGALGFWKAPAQVFPKTREQRCWVHKTVNVLDQLPKRIQLKAKEMIHPIWLADTREHAHQAFDLFLETYRAKYPKACECLQKDRDALLALYDFPAEHWKHLRTTGHRPKVAPIDSTFATVRLRTKKTKESGSRTACLTMVYKLMQSAQKWRLLNGSSVLPVVSQGI